MKRTSHDTSRFTLILYKSLVGYSNTDTDAVGGNTLLSASFMSVGNADQQFKLGDIKGGGYGEGEEAWGEVTLKVLGTNGLPADDEDTGLKKVYQWQDNEDHVPAGWYDESGDVRWSDEITFDAGQGFYTQGYGYTLQSAGEVNTEPVSVGTDKVGGNTLIGNPYPCQITLADISGGGYGEGEEAWGEVTLKVLGTNGLPETDKTTALLKVYQWQDNEDHDPAGWYDESGDVRWDDTTPFPVGQAFYTQGYGYTVDFTFPKATED